jgi:hypothetical protein
MDAADATIAGTDPSLEQPSILQPVNSVGTSETKFSRARGGAIHFGDL